jgi:hypothetical protein
MKTTIELAREAGAEFAELPMMNAFVFSVDDKHWNSKELERFVALVRADERNLWPVEMEAMERQVNILTDALAAEREACAKLCEGLPMQQKVDVRDQCAAAIRNRGNI